MYVINVQKKFSLIKKNILKTLTDNLNKSKDVQNI